MLSGAALLAAGCAAPHMKGTPFYTGEYATPQGPPEDRVNLWPIAYYRKPALSVMWPIAEWTDDHVALRPAFSVYKLDQQRHQWNVAAPLAQFDFDTGEHRVLPFLWGEDRFTAFPLVHLDLDEGRYVVLPFLWGEDYFVGFPLVWLFDETKGVFPAFWWDEGLTVFPLYWRKKGGYHHLPPLWWHWPKDGGHDTHVLWPLFHRVETGEKKGFRVWPFVGRYEGNDWRHAFALWPLCHDYRQGDERTRVAFPLYFEHREKDKAWRLLLPLIYRQTEGDDSLTLTPLWTGGKKGQRRWSALIPLYYHDVDDATGERFLLTPLVGSDHTPDRTEWALMPILSSFGWGKGGKELWALAPLVHARWGGENVQHHALPFYYYDRDDGMFLSPLVSWQKKDGGGFLNLGSLLTHYSYGSDGHKRLLVLPPLFAGGWGKGTHDYWLPWPLARAKRGEDSVTHHVFPLYYYGREGDEALTFRLLVMLARYARAANGRKQLGLPLTEIAWGGPDGGAKAGTFPLFHWQRRATERTRKHKPAGRDVKEKEQSRSLTVPSILPLFHTWTTQREATPAHGQPGQAHTRRERRHWLFPLWHYRSASDAYQGAGPKTDRREADFRLLGWLYDRRVRSGAELWDDKQPHDYVRSRVLWRVMHYEWLDGDQSLDVFPFLTWDCKKDGYRQTSFLWRLFRSQRGADGSRKLDVLFIPLLRRP